MAQDFVTLEGNETMPERRWAGTFELARIIGISEQTVRRLVREGRIPALRIGTRLRYDIDQVTQALST